MSFALGAFSYKNYYIEYDNSLHLDEVIDIYDKQASFGLGGISSIGIYAKYKRIGINPSVQLIFSGGNDNSFLFYGFCFPITIDLY